MKNIATKDEFDMYLEVADKEADMTWSLRDLGKVYFNVLPTFPGMYTYVDGQDQKPILNPNEWPSRNSDPGRNFKSCRPQPMIQAQ